MKIRYYIVVVVIILNMLPVCAQQSVFHLDRNGDLRRGYELFEKEKYSTAQKFFASAFAKYESTNTGLAAQSQYYVALCAMRLFNDDAEYLTLKFISDNEESPLVNEAYFNLAGYFYARQKWNEAVVYYKKCNTYRLTHEQKAECCFKAGYALFSLKKTDEAKVMFYQIKDEKTKYSSPALYYYSHIHYDEKNYQTALNGFLNLTGDKNFGGIAPYYVVQIYYMQEKYQEITEYVPGIYKNVTSKRLAEVSRITAEAYSQLGRYKESLPYYDTYMDSASFVSKEDKYQAGYAHYKSESYERAIELLGSISSTESQLGQNAAYYLADCYIKTNDKQKARMAFQSASKMDFDPAIKQDALYNYALITYELSHDPFNEAIRAFEDFIRLYPESKRIDDAYKYLIQSYLNAHNYKMALESLEKTGLKSDDLKRACQKISLFRGIELFNNLEYAQAIQHFNKSLQYSSYDAAYKARAYYWKGEAAYQNRDFTNALEYYKDFEAYSGSGTFEEYDLINYNKGYCWFRLRNYDKAVESFRLFISDNPSCCHKQVGDALNRTGDCYYARTDYNKAVEYYTKAASYPDANVEYALLQKGLCQGLANNDEQKVTTLLKLVNQNPKSIYADQALFEMALSNIKLKQQDEAIRNLKTLVSDFPQSKFSAGALIQLGLLYYNRDDHNTAIKYYKETVTRFPGSQEAKDALFGLKNISVDLNETDDYVSFVNNLGSSAPQITYDEKDSLTYIAAEKIYMSGNCDESSRAFENYISKYQKGNFLLNAHFYKGDCNYQKKDYQKALESFGYVLSKPSNMFTEQALLGSARIEIDKKNYDAAIDRYSRLIDEFPAPGNTKEASVALMRCCFTQGKYQDAHRYAYMVLKQSNMSPEIVREAHFIAARALQETGRDMLAIEEYKNISSEVMSREGAEAKYHLAELYFKQGQTKEAEREIIDFSEKPSPHEYWIARSFILWADIFVKQNDYFQAIQTLESLMDYYEIPDDGIIEKAKTKKAQIVKLQEANEQPKERENVEINIE